MVSLVALQELLVPGYSDDFGVACYITWQPSAGTRVVQDVPLRQSPDLRTLARLFSDNLSFISSSLVCISLLALLALNP
jgi:hypothetical protein